MTTFNQCLVGEYFWCFGGEQSHLWRCDVDLRCGRTGVCGERVQHFEIAVEPKVVKLGSILWTFGMLLCFVGCGYCGKNVIVTL